VPPHPRVSSVAPPLPNRTPTHSIPIPICPRPRSRRAVAFQETPLQTFWPLVIGAIAVFEIFSVFTFNSPVDGGEMWTMRDDYENGNLGFDPLRLRPESIEEFKDLQTKELNNGRLAMIAMAGMAAQELVTGQRLMDSTAQLFT